MKTEPPKEPLVRRDPRPMVVENLLRDAGIPKRETLVEWLEKNSPKPAKPTTAECITHYVGMGFVVLLIPVGLLVPWFFWSLLWDAVLWAGRLLHRLI